MRSKESGVWLHRDEWHEVEQRERGYVALRRTGTPIPDARDEMARVMGSIERSLSQLDRSQTLLQVDLRDARGRNDPVFEVDFVPYRRRLYSGWKRVFVLCKTIVGKMQIERHARDDGHGADWQVFVSEDELEAAVQRHLAAAS